MPNVTHVSAYVTPTTITSYHKNVTQTPSPRAHSICRARTKPRRKMALRVDCAWKEKEKGLWLIMQRRPLSLLFVANVQQEKEKITILLHAIDREGRRMKCNPRRPSYIIIIPGPPSICPQQSSFQFGIFGTTPFGRWMFPNIYPGVRGAAFATQEHDQSS